MKIARIDTFPYKTAARCLRVQVGFMGLVDMKKLVDFADVEANLHGFYGADLDNLELPVRVGGEYYVQDVWYYNRK